MDNSKAIEYAKEITIAALSGERSTAFIGGQGAKEVANFFETVFEKIKELETKN